MDTNWFLVVANAALNLAQTYPLATLVGLFVVFGVGMFKRSSYSNNERSYRR
jgi:MFS superfamily sulfate permease-like transporter